MSSTTTIATTTEVTIHGDSKWPVPWASISPQLGVGGGSPKPR